MANPNALQWNGSPGHYEVYYLTFTDPASRIGFWIRYTMVAPLPSTGEPATASLWFLAMDPADGGFGALGRKTSFEIGALSAERDPFELRIGDSVLGDTGMSGGFEDVSWKLTWSPGRGYAHVHPLLRPVAATVLVLPHADVQLAGTVTIGDRTLEIAGARGGQAHLWGSKHASRWAWIHCNDFETESGEPLPGEFVDGVSIFAPRFGRELGPNSPFVGRVGGEDFSSRSALRVLTNRSTFDLTSWQFQVVGGNRKLVGEVQAEQRLLAGVTYHDPDGDLAYCYNGETASMQLRVYDRSGLTGWTHRSTLVSRGRAHFEYAQRTPVPGVELLTK